MQYDIILQNYKQIYSNSQINYFTYLNNNKLVLALDDRLIIHDIVLKYDIKCVHVQVCPEVFPLNSFEILLDYGFKIFKYSIKESKTIVLLEEYSRYKLLKKFN